uniref:Uncharacterized protein n=1 Tax=Aplanochytrium stocchinoi TaxID=215587 RepID=A0A7S3PP76_9STRA|mmetsp:Transcript_9350/g.10854  ORF Transcript_9350/g.10854 Transcript_9350/m.10854 type:complete len:321 (+) Transcript_9350:254-1216(+)|eukprot:CAMPEP_0204836074 /NCGR_PEP_ID=MMETSP1346-20131115/24239_1 /ASSEMBLY_ACC=CAM_ASM_000771 /TAXON_ID=215587 /ORGANISM="Aplanochytrium stocchinoi, Strain GSBS06" /LENGTH=320 /DNA_ID=CAMNT_0051970541 /DNA_START=124 /DNA_END=1086 /DNA_ORIENTATION=-
MDVQNVPVYELLKDCLSCVHEAKHTVRKIKQYNLYFSDNRKIDQKEREDIFQVNIGQEGSSKERIFEEKCTEHESKLDQNLSESEGLKTHAASGLKSFSKSDEKAKQTLKYFANEVAVWRKLKIKHPSPTKFSTYLTEKYISNILDPLPKTKLVSIASKAILLEVEKLKNLEKKSTKASHAWRKQQENKPTATVSDGQNHEKVAIQSASVLRRQQILKQRREYRKHQEKIRNKSIHTVNNKQGNPNTSVSVKKDVCDKAEYGFTNTSQCKSARKEHLISNLTIEEGIQTFQNTEGKTDLDRLILRAESQEKQLEGYRKRF